MVPPNNGCGWVTSAVNGASSVPVVEQSFEAAIRATEIVEIPDVGLEGHKNSLEAVSGG